MVNLSSFAISYVSLAVVVEDDELSGTLLRDPELE